MGISKNICDYDLYYYKYIRTYDLNLCRKACAQSVMRTLSNQRNHLLVICQSFKDDCGHV
jgi:hypothetical protein